MKYGINEYGTAVSMGTCQACGDPFTVCPSVKDWASWGGEVCLAPHCASYDPKRDVDRLFESGDVDIHREPVCDPKELP